MLWFLATLVACNGATPDSGDTTADVYDHPLFATLAPATLPYTLHEDDAAHPRGFFYTSGVTTQQTSEPVVAVATFDDLVAVVYPDADNGRALAVAWAAPELGWQRQIVADNARLVEDVDAVSVGDTLHIGARYSDGSVHHLTWTPPTSGSEGVVTSEQVATTEVGWAVRECADMAVGVAPTGEVDLLWQGPRTLQHGRRDLEGTWAVSDALPIEGWGCRNMLDYDESGLPYVMSTSRSYYGVPDGFPVNMVGERNEVSTLKWGANGRFQSGGTLAYALYVPTVTPPEPSESRGFGWLDHHELSGAILGGTAFQEVRVGFEFFSPSEVFDSRPGTANSNPFLFDCGGDCTIAAGLGGTVDVVGADLNDCGRVVLFYQGSGQPNSFPAHTFEDGSATCESSNHAPVLWRDDDFIDPLELERVVFSHGRRPYTAAVCTSTSGTLALCFGGYGEQLSRAHSEGRWGNLGTALLDPDGPPLVPADRIPEFTWASVSPDVPVPIDVDAIEVSYSHIDFDLPSNQAEATVRPVLRDVYWGFAYPKTTNTYDPVEGKVRMTLKEPLLAGHSYRIDLVGLHPDGQYLELQGKGLERFVHFTAEGVIPRRSDPRNTLVRGLENCTRHEGGVCILEGSAGATELSYGEEELRGWPESGPVVVRAPDGRVVSGVTTNSAFRVGFSVALTEPLEASAGNYTVELPEMYDGWGVRLDEPVEIDVLPLP